MKNNLTQKAPLSGISSALKHQTSVGSKLITNYENRKPHSTSHPFIFGEQSALKNFENNKQNLSTEITFHSTVKSMSLLFATRVFLSNISISRLSSEEKERKRNTEQQEVCLWFTGINIRISGLLPTADRHQRDQL